MSTKKDVNITSAKELKEKVSDIETFGNPDAFLLISKASSKSQGWMKSTKAMCCGRDVVVQTTTQMRNPDGSYALTDSLTCVQDAAILEIKDETGAVIGRQICQIGTAGHLESENPAKYRRIDGNKAMEW